MRRRDEETKRRSGNRPAFGAVVPAQPEPRRRKSSVVPAKAGTTAPALSHLDARGAARMVDVGDKPPMKREAIAEGFLIASPATLDRLFKGDLPKGEALSTARIAGIAAAKKCDELIPLCHTLPLDSVNVDFERFAKSKVRIVATARITAKTGVEMEALVAVSIAALTLYDMTKAIDKKMRIEGVRLVSKTKTPA